MRERYPKHDNNGRFIGKAWLWEQKMAFQKQASQLAEDNTRLRAKLVKVQEALSAVEQILKEEQA
jgi:hypothetical protein